MSSRFPLWFAVCLTTYAVASGSGAAEWREGVELYRNEEYQKARDLFERAVDADPENAEYHLWLGLATGRRAEQLSGFRRLSALSLAKRVRVEFETAAELDPKNLAVLEALLGFHLDAPGIVGGDKARAIGVAEQIEEVDPARGAAAFAGYHEDRGDFEQAGEFHIRARELAPDEIRYLLGHATFLSRRGRQAESDRLFDAAFERASENPDVWLAAGRSWIEAKRRPRYPQARELLERYIASPNRKPNSDPVWLVRRLLKQL